MTDPIPDPTPAAEQAPPVEPTAEGLRSLSEGLRRIGEPLAAVLGNSQPPTAADLFEPDQTGARDLLAQVQEANSSRAGGWVTTNLAGQPINDDHTWKDVR